MPTTRCPYCFTDIAARPETVFTCDASCATSNTAEAKAKHQAYGTEPVQRLSRATKVNPDDPRPTSLPCWDGHGGCRVRTSKQVCPECYFVLPDRWRDSVTTCVAMAGARASGKSFYIAVMAHALQHLFNQMGGPFAPANAKVQEHFSQRYEDPVYVERGLLEPTRPLEQSSDELAPLIFTAGKHGPYPHHLVIRDVAGEDLQAPRPEQWHATRWFDFFKHADSVLFLFDPMQVDEITHMLEGLVPNTSDDRNDPMAAFDTLLAKLQQPPRPTVMPWLGVVLAKFDVLQELANVQGSYWAEIMGNRGAAFLRDPSLASPAYDDADGRLLHEEARSLLIELHGTPLLNRLRDAQLIHRLFTVSSLGQHAEGDQIHVRGISPFRCADPLKWVLAGRSQVIPVKNAPMQAAG